MLEVQLDAVGLVSGLFTILGGSSYDLPSLQCPTRILDVPCDLYMFERGGEGVD